MKTFRCSFIWENVLSLEVKKTHVSQRKKLKIIACFVGGIW